MKETVRSWTGYVGVFLGATVALALAGQYLDDRPTREEMHRAIRTQAPYVEDRAKIEAELKDVRSMEKEVLRALQANAEALKELAEALRE